jgi:hypothetical protein
MGDVDKSRLDAETRQQLYGGEISDYYKNPQKELKDDNKELGNIYTRMNKKLFKLDTSNDLNNKSE